MSGEGTERTDEARFRAIVEGLNDWIWEVDAEGKYTYSNPQITAILGYQIDEVIGKTPFDFMPPDEIERVGPIFGRYVQEQVKFQNLENTILHKDGSRIVVETSGLPIFDTDGTFTGFRGADRDITVQKAAEERFQSLVEGLNDWVWELDSEGRFTYCSGQVKTILGYEPDEVIGRTILDFMEPEEAQRIGSILAETINQNRSKKLIFTTRHLHKDGHVVIIEASSSLVFNGEGEVTGFRGTNRDVTGERATEEITKRLQAGVEQISDGMVVTDMDGNMQFANSAWTKMHGYDSSEEQIGENLAMFHTPEQLQQEVIPFNQIVAEKGTHQGEVGHITKDGEEFTAFMSVSLIRDDEGNPTGLVAAARDVTEEKKAREVVNRLQAGVEQISDGMVVTDMDGNMQFANSAWTKMHGYDSSEEQIGENLAMFHTPEQLQQEVIPFNQIVAEKGTHQGEVGHITKDGEEFTAFMSVSLIRDDDGNPTGLVAAARDVTEEKKAREVVNRLQAGVEQISDGMVVTDMDGNMQFANSAWTKMHGYDSSEEQIGENLAMFHTPEQLQQEVIPFNQIVAEKGTHQGEVGHITKDGEEFTAFMSVSLIRDDEGNPTGLVAAARDVTEEKKARDIVNRLQAGVEQISDGMVVTDIDGNMQFANSAWTKMHGYDNAEEQIGKNLAMFHTPEQLQEEVIPFNQTVAKKGSNQGEVGHITKDGKEFLTQMSVSVMKDSDGIPTGLVATARDITEQKQAEEQLREQSRAIMELSTPVIRVWDEILLLPMIGSMDTTRAQQMTGRVLEEVATSGSRVVLMDVTGVPTIDTSVARHVLSTVEACRILGAEVIVTGFSPEAAQTLAQLGVDFASLRTRGSLKAGMIEALGMVGQRVHMRNNFLQ